MLKNKSFLSLEDSGVSLSPGDLNQRLLLLLAYGTTADIYAIYIYLNYVVRSSGFTTPCLLAKIIKHLFTILQILKMAGQNQQKS
jgi:cobalamin biosynthesis Co2+ chelatase CbiK